MIHYQLVCGDGHEFDGWFTDSAGFEAQAARQLISCPICASTAVNRALMAPAIPRKTAVARTAPATPQATGGIMPDQVRHALRQLRREIEANCDYVGPSFAEEARRIYYGEATPRGIYGESTDAEAEALADEGIDIARIPWVPVTDT